MVTVKTDVEAPAVKEEIPHDHLFKVTGLSSTNLEKLAQGDGQKCADLGSVIKTTGWSWDAARSKLGLHTANVTLKYTGCAQNLNYVVPEPSDFEAAIAATGFGRFNIFLMLCSLPAFWSAVSVTSSVSYIFTRAQCDMSLSLLDMGTINAITYGGMISSAMVWGFLSDTLGRRRIMAYGFFCSGLVEIAAAMSQSFIMLLLTRFASGFLFNGPFAVLLSYLAELHRTELRARVILLTSLFYTVANTTLPMLAWAILTKDWQFHIYGDTIVIHSWNLFLFATALVPLLTGVAFLCLPESPKFLMSRGRNDEAMKIFRKIYSMNMDKPAEDYPITQLVEEKTEEQARGVAALRGGVAQLLPLFRPPHAKWLLLICFIHLGCMFGSNTIRLWYPQLAAMIGSETNGSLCSAIAPGPVLVADEACVPIETDILTYLQSAVVGAGSVLTYGVGGALINSHVINHIAPGPVLVTDEACVPIETDILTYLQNAVVGAGSVLTYGVGGALINRCGKKVVVGVSGVISAGLVVLLPLLGHDALSVAALVTAVLAFTSLFGASMHSVAVDLFPTSLRVMATATFLMSGRLGTIAGTVIFPALVTYGCWPPFITIAAVLGVCGLTCCMLPNTTLKKLE